VLRLKSSLISVDKASEGYASGTIDPMREGEDIVVPLPDFVSASIILSTTPGISSCSALVPDAVSDSELGPEPPSVVHDIPGDSSVVP
jgi:hypothetical protein